MPKFSLLLFNVHVFKIYGICREAALGVNFCSKFLHFGSLVNANFFKFDTNNSIQLFDNS